MRPVLLPVPLALALVALATPARGEPDPVVVRVTQEAPVFQSAAEGAPQVGVVLAGQLYVHLPEEGAQGERKRIRFTNDVAWVERAALEPLPGYDLYAVATSPVLQVSALGTLDNGALVAPIKHLPDLDLTLISYGGRWVWIPRGTLRGPVDLTRPRARPASARASARAEDRTVGSAPAGFSPSAPVEALPGGSGNSGDSDEGEGEGQPLATSEPAPGAPANDDAAPSGDLGQPGAGRVVYGGRTVSSAAVRGFLQRLADFTGRTVRVTSGDRNYVPRGGSRTSLHLRHRAADFVVEGQSLGQTFELIRANRGLLFAGGSYELIWHQPGTNTSGPHLHAGDYGDGRGSVFKTESRGSYRRVP